MNVRTGETVYEQVISLDVDNNPISGATFDSVLYLDDSLYTGTTPSYSLTDGSRAIFTFSWSADTVGDYQMYVRNNLTNVIFMSDVVGVRPDSEFDSTIYIGL